MPWPRMAGSQGTAHARPETEPPAGQKPRPITTRGGVRGAAWPDASHEQVATVTTDELNGHLAQVTYRLLLPLARFFVSAVTSR
jgi:hypothetical protein